MINHDAKYIGDIERGVPDGKVSSSGVSSRDISGDGVSCDAKRSGDFEMLDVSGDVGLRVRAVSLQELFVKAGLACSALMIDPHGVQAAVSLEIEADVVSETDGLGVLSQAGADDGTLEELLVAWLNELIYRFDAEGFAAARITVLEFSPARIKTVVSGQHYDPRIHTPGLLVKAATHHGLKILKTNDTYLADIVFDI
jgi:SHS2 domain-containing protein